jgi:cytochrome c
MTDKHGMWTITGTPDVKATACMTNCVTEVKITSALPDFARNAHNNLAEQDRTFGPYRGSDSTKPPLKALPGTNYVASVTTVKTAAAPNQAAPAKPAAANADTAALQQSFTKNNCAACHAPAAKGVGPSNVDIAKKYKGQDVLAKLSAKVKNGGSGAWGMIPMPPHPQVPDAEINRLVQWMLTGT